MRKLWGPLVGNKTLGWQLPFRGYPGGDKIYISGPQNFHVVLTKLGVDSEEPCENLPLGIGQELGLGSWFQNVSLFEYQPGIGGVHPKVDWGGSGKMEVLVLLGQTRGASRWFGITTGGIR